MADLIAGVDYAKIQPGVSVVSMSWDVPEYRIEAATDSTFTTAANHPVTFVASAGDYGSPPEYPATSPNVLAVGGTTLTLATGGGYGSETAWSSGGGGVSTVEKEPAYQDGAQNTGYRSDPDVSYDADPNTGFAVYDTINDRYGTGWEEIGGTSAGAPQWSALIAIADEGLAAAGNSALAQAQARLYSLPANAFHDMTNGNNGSYAAAAGYDAVTGLGRPVANVLIEDLDQRRDRQPDRRFAFEDVQFRIHGCRDECGSCGGRGAVYHWDDFRHARELWRGIVAGHRTARKHCGPCRRQPRIPAESGDRHAQLRRQRRPERNRSGTRRRWIGDQRVRQWTRGIGLRANRRLRRSDVELDAVGILTCV